MLYEVHGLEKMLNKKRFEDYDKETIDKHINHLSENDFLNLYKIVTKNIMSNEL